MTAGKVEAKHVNMPDVSLYRQPPGLAHLSIRSNFFSLIEFIC
jgi:hypothetical protein